MALDIRSADAADQSTIAQLCWDYRALLIERAVDNPGVVEAAYAEADYAALLADLPRIHARPKGDMLVAVHEAQLVGCAMYYPLGPPGVTEMKRVYVAPMARGLGAGRALMQEGIRRAAADGYTRMVVDTIAPLHEAIALYESLGFAPCPPFYEPDPAFTEMLRFFDLPLGDLQA